MASLKISSSLEGAVNRVAGARKSAQLVVESNSDASALSSYLPSFDIPAKQFLNPVFGNPNVHIQNLLKTTLSVEPQHVEFEDDKTYDFIEDPYGGFLEHLTRYQRTGDIFELVHSIDYVKYVSELAEWIAKACIGIRCKDVSEFLEISKNCGFMSRAYADFITHLGKYQIAGDLTELTSAMECVLGFVATTTRIVSASADILLIDGQNAAAIRTRSDFVCGAYKSSLNHLKEFVIRGMGEGSAETQLDELKIAVHHLQDAADAMNFIPLPYLKAWPRDAANEGESRDEIGRLHSLLQLTLRHTKLALYATALALFNEVSHPDYLVSSMADDFLVEISQMRMGIILKIKRLCFFNNVDKTGKPTDDSLIELY